MYRILIADDEPLITQGLKALIEREEPEIKEIAVAADGEEALEWMENGKNLPDILITDIRMPGRNGIELVKKIREEGWKVRVIVLSGYNDFEYVRSMAVLGIENYLLKPVNSQELHATIQNVLEKVKREQKQRVKAEMDENLIRENIINRWLYDSIGEAELLDRAEFLDMDLELSWYQPCILKLLGDGQEVREQREKRDAVFHVCIEEFMKEENCYFSKNYSGDTIAVFCGEEEAAVKNREVLNRCMEAVKERLGFKIYVLLGEEVEGYWNVAASFREAVTKGIYLDEIAEGKEKIDGASSPLARRMAEYVLAHYTEDLSLKTLGGYFKGNPAYLGQIFRRDTGKSFSEYLKDIRIARAKDLLKGGKYSAQEISSRVGFSNVTYFTSVFKKETGLSPAEYKKTFKE